MLIDTPKGKTVSARYLACDIEPRYLVDSEINGESDIDEDEQYDEEKDSRMPLMIKTHKSKPDGIREFLNVEYHWLIIIDLDNGRILDWRNDSEAKIHYKVCDQGKYSFLDDDLERMTGGDKTRYVPSLLDFRNDCFGDYLCFNVDKNGFIREWSLLPEDKRKERAETLWRQLEEERRRGEK